MALNPVDDDFVVSLVAQLPEDTLRPTEPRYLEEPRGRWQGVEGCLALPRTTRDVSTILAAANEARVPVIPFGGGTGLVGGQVYPEGPTPLILSLERMNRVLSVDAEENVIIAQAGAVLDSLHQAAENRNRLFPLAIASSGTAQIGGNLATNAGGVNVLRYGNARDLCLGLEVVLPDGRIWSGLSRLRKDNTGYDLRNLMIGSEGTLGVITAASLKLFPQPESYATALFTVPTPQAAIRLLELVQGKVGEAVSAFELLHRNGYVFLKDTMPDFRQPFDDPPEWTVLLDLGLSQGVEGQVVLEEIFAEAFEAGMVSDGLLASSLTQRDEFWALRETIPHANRAVGAIASHDISLPVALVPEFIDTVMFEINGLADVRVNCFGHLGDGNLHFNVFPAEGRDKAEYQSKRAVISGYIHDVVCRLDGSFSAEHGVGRLKTGELQTYGDPVRLDLMAGIKRQFDPNGIMNPGVIFPSQ